LSDQLDVGLAGGHGIMPTTYRAGSGLVVDVVGERHCAGNL